MIVRLLSLLSLFLGMSCSIPSGLFSQPVSSPLLLKHGAVSLQKNVDWFGQHRSSYSSSAYRGVYYLVLQFETLPDFGQREILANRNIRLLQYLGERAYVVEMSENLPLSKLKGVGIQSIEPIRPSWKHDPRLPDHVPEWAKPAEGMADVNVLLQIGVSFDEAKQDLLRMPDMQLLFAYEPANLLRFRLSLSSLDALFALPFVNYVEPIDPPAELENHEAGIMYRSNFLSANGLKYTGAGVDVAIGDDGGIGPHIDFQGRKGGIHTAGDGGNHGDHVAGTILGAGNLNPRHRGMAYGATLHEWDYWDAIFSFPQSYTQDEIRITSQSLGNGCNAGYNSLAQLVDRQSRTHESLIHVFSAGNSGGSNCGGIAGGWQTITGGIKSGKNVLAVGAVDDNGNRASFSSKGPATDGRIKPDLCAVGVSVQSTLPNHTYASSIGTSMACPGVSGTLAQLYEAYRDLFNGSEPPGGLMKAILLNTASDKGNPGPDFSYGWGVINARAAYQCLSERRFLSDAVDQGGTVSHTLSIPTGSQRARLMLYWTDPEASLSASSALVNDLDITVEGPDGTIFLPWLLDAGPTPTTHSCQASATRGVDSKNNMEQVEISLPVAGEYQVQISGSHVPQGPQAYYLVYEWIDDAVTLTYPLGGESWVPGELERIHWDAEGNSGFFSLEYSTNGGHNWQPVASVGGSARSHMFTIPNTITGQGMVRISRAGISSQSGSFFSVLPVPQNLQINGLCRGVVELGWDHVSGAMAYEVFQLGTSYMKSIGKSTTEDFQIHGLKPDSTYWFSVRALGTDGAKGRRAVAVAFAPSSQNACNFSAVGIRSLVEPVSESCTSLPMSVQAKVENIGPNPLSVVSISYQVDDEIPVNEPILGINSGEILDFSFSNHIQTLTPGLHTLKIWIDNLDGHTADDTLVETFRYVPQITQYPYFEDFEENDGGWMTQGKNNSWEWGTPAAANIEEAASGIRSWITSLQTIHKNNEDSYLFSPCFDLSGFGADPILSFSMAYELEEERDFAWVEYTEDGVNWTKLGGSGSGGFNWYAASGGRWSGLSQHNVWRMASCPIPVSSMNDASQVRVRFVLSSNGKDAAEGIAIDDVHIHAAQDIYEGATLTNLTQSVQGNDWVPILHNGELIAAIHPQGQNLGNVQLSTYRSNGQTRHFNGRYYLDQSWVISPQNQPASPVGVRLYYPDTEVWELYSANHCSPCEGIEHPYRLGLSKYHGTNEDGDLANSVDPAFQFLSGSTVQIIPFRNGYYLETQVAAFSEFWVNGGGALGNSGSFPVEFLEFEVEQNQGGALLTWSTASEQQNAGFAIESSFEGGLFQRTSFVTGAGTTQEVQTYSHHVADLQPGIYHFRLKQLDVDGGFAYSETRELLIVARNEVSVFPNPFDTHLQVSLQSKEEQGVSIHLFDPLGRELKSHHIPALAGGLTYLFPIPGRLDPGLYFFQVTMGQEVFGQRVWKK